MLQDCASPSFISPGASLISKLAWYAYDYLLTIPLEVEAIWKSKPSVTTILFLINRYAFIVTWILIIVLSSITTHVTVSLQNLQPNVVLYRLKRITGVSFEKYSQLVMIDLTKISSCKNLINLSAAANILSVSSISGIFVN